VKKEVNQPVGRPDVTKKKKKKALLRDNVMSISEQGKR